MTFDGLMTHAVVSELNTTLADGKITKIQQPYPNEVILTIRANRKTYPLLLSAHPSYARVQVTHVPYANPATPPNFAMSLRKYLDGAILEKIEQVESDRILKFTFKSRNELGDLQQLCLIVELMGRHSNVILVNQETNKILDLIRHVGVAQNRYRFLMPGADYVNPPAASGIDGFTSDLKTLDWLSYYSESAEMQVKWLQQQFQGMSRESAIELQTRLIDHDHYLTIVTHFFEQFDQVNPTLTISDKKSWFTAFVYQSLAGTLSHFDTLSELLDQYYLHKAQRDRVRQQGGALIHFIRNEIQKDEKKLKKLQKTLKAADSADDYRIRGEILTTYLREVERGMTEVTLPNFYADNQPLKITLSNQISPSKNAQKYFAKYQKLRNSIAYVNDQLAKTEAELTYFKTIMAQIEIAAPKDLEDIKAELQAEGYLKVKKNGAKKQKRYKVSEPEVFYATDGTRIFVGKNNYQNDQLTLKKAHKTDIWLHVKHIPGSHVIIDSADPSAETIQEAGNLAAYFSKARLSAAVPVDYIQVKKIKKPNGAKPGFVVYEGQQTLYTTPDEQLVQRLRKKPTLA
ncbi:NFACT RNA binding domain-containing protein [Latilactobacillus graminis]|uniref:Rqc2 homolog RqcH n=2 Tax=Latilactobacillus graminis TaxID=60519 RepID=A0AA89I0F6_9LACO|nr:NFACT RNA binding domain-containing protein [Latilactobacillus graminis]KRM21937.1 fibronectin fibrinogene-binding protein [Latilactobacillus graminis DSM 20719]QFP79626.1 fibronectin/fibrinogen-binding protein [Latilactobacillus graminis]